MDQWLIAALAMVAFLAFVAFAYIFSEERKSRKLDRRMADAGGPDTIETRSRRAF